VLLERGAWASSLQGSGEVVSVPGWHRARNERRKSGRVEPDINNVHYWFAVMLPWEGDFAWSFEARFGERASSGNERYYRSCSLRVGFKEGKKGGTTKARKKVAVPRSGTTIL